MPQKRQKRRFSDKKENERIEGYSYKKKERIYPDRSGSLGVRSGVCREVIIRGFGDL